ncbi:MAG: alanine racemase [Firmicutes bacterium]|nr:alanine racemase [Bacillota bacterium]
MAFFILGAYTTPMIPASTITVSADALTHNAVTIKSRLPAKTKLCAVVKANAYGHGVKFAVTTLEPYADFFAAATNHEALEVRKLTQRPTLVMDSLKTSALAKCLKQNIHISVCSLNELKILLSAAKKAGTTAQVHIKLNTGMNRFGISGTDEFSCCIKLIKNQPTLTLAGVYTHFGAGDNPSHPRTHGQAKRFKQFLAILPPELKPIIHAANTDTALNFPQYAFDMVRVGIGLYGYGSSTNQNSPPWRGGAERRGGFTPVLTLTSYIAAIQTVAKGQYIGYGTGTRAKRNMTVGIIPLGYADGISRSLSNKGKVIISGLPAPIIGNICMDSFTVDLTENSPTPAGWMSSVAQTDGVAAAEGGVKTLAVGTPVTIIGPDQTAADIAETQGTIAYEVLTGINHCRINYQTKNPNKKSPLS